MYEGKTRNTLKKKTSRNLTRKIVALVVVIALITNSEAFGNMLPLFYANNVTVQAATKKPTAIKLNMTKKTLYVGKSATLKVKKVTPAKASTAVTWKSSNKKIATVTSKGKVTAKKAGTANITATSKSNKKVKAVCKITVKKKETSTKQPKETPAPTAVIATAPPVEGDIVYSGAYGSTTWTIDKNGLLEVKGTGNMWEENGEPGWNQYTSEIKSAKIEVTGATDLSNMFMTCEKLVDVDLRGLDTSNVTKMDGMFELCSSLKEVDVSHFDTSNVTDMSAMFVQCSSLTELDLSNFDTSNITRAIDMSMMFYDTSALSTIYTPKKTGAVVPDLPSGIWNGSDGTSYTTFPENATESITLTKIQF